MKPVLLPLFAATMLFAANAPVLAIFSNGALRAAPVLEISVKSPMLGGYAGDIAASAQGFILGCPRAGGIAFFDQHGGFQSFAKLPEACAVTAGATGGQNRIWVAGYPQAMCFKTDPQSTHTQCDTFELPAMRLDNHWSCCVATPAIAQVDADVLKLMPN